MGFAGLQRTVVERLLAEAEPTDAPPSACLADVQHVMGGCCAAGGVQYDAALADVRAAVEGMQRTVDRYGGAASELARQLARAQACLGGTRSERSQRPATEWEAVRSLLAAWLPDADWFGTDERDAAARRVMDQSVVASHRAAVAAAGAMREAWTEATRAEHARRRRLDAAFAVGRVALRAWREVVDDVRAGAAKWSQRFGEAQRCGHGCALGRRLDFAAPAADAAAMSDTEWSAWRMFMLLLAYQRLVGSARVRSQRLRSATWRRSDTARRRSQACGAWAAPLGGPAVVAAMPGAAPQPAAGHTGHVPTSGAAAVIERRARRAALQRQVVSDPSDRATREVMRVSAARAAVLPTHVPAEPRRRRTAREMTVARARSVARRRHDGQLRLDGPVVQERMLAWAGAG